VEELLRLYHRLSARQRHHLLSVLRAMAKALTASTGTKPSGGEST
jgi:hypothetical protein